MKKIILGLGAVALVAVLCHCRKNNEAHQVVTPVPVSVNTNAAFAAISQYRAGIGSNEVYAHYFSKDIYTALLSAPGATGIRIYNALHTNTGQRDVVIVATDKDDNDLLAAGLSGATPAAANGTPCPTACGAAPGDSSSSRAVAAGSFVSTGAAQSLTRAYRATFPRDSYHAYNFTKETIQRILMTPGVEGIRIYRATNASGKPTLVLLATDGYRNDSYNGSVQFRRIALEASAKGKDSSTTIGDDPTPCPSICGTSVSALNE